mmetsp:Transcript_97067/g.257916  ORF Transcript_97067/g.257916 Transcript_97067/m.257916 type:complete len:338 (-) Transcript_97067:22-1035(-)
MYGYQQGSPYGTSTPSNAYGATSSTHQFPENPYGSSMPGQMSSTKVGKTPFLRGLRRRLNVLAILISLFVPWSLFVGVFALFSFQLHYSHPGITYFLAFVIFLGVMIHARFAYYARLNSRISSEAEREPSWMVFQSATLIMALFAAVVLGVMNYRMFTLQYHQVTSLNDYQGVDPSRMRGQQLLDAGSVMFTRDSTLDTSKSMGFRNLDTFCVAPIAIGGKEHATYDFWAVGRNCCSGTRADFHCAHYRNPRAHGALRLVRTTERAYYRLAVQQAEATYNIHARHPLFFQWEEDPAGVLKTWRANSIRNFVFAMSGHFVFQTFIVAAATVSFTKIGS